MSKMVENPDHICFDDGEVDANVDDDSSDDEIRCVKLKLPENIAAYLGKKELIRDEEVITCDKSLVEKVTLNYVIVKKILSNLVWQEKLLCKHVCSTWHSAVCALHKEQLGPTDFVIDLQICAIRGGIKYKKSSNFYTEPLAVLTFANTASLNITTKCEVLVPSPCEPSCEKEHCLIDVVQHSVSAPKDCMLTVKAIYLSYLPLPQSITYEHTITHHMFRQQTPFIGGVCIPAIADVEFKVINIKSVSDMQQDFYDIVDKLAQDRILKGVLVYVTESYIFQSVEDIVFLNYFKDVQPNIPYALGGCLVEDATFKQSDVSLIIDRVNEGKNYISENLISIGLFTVPKKKSSTEENANFDMYSLIIESSDWTKAKIQKTINEFSKKVPRFEHSVVIKLSCMGRDQKHELEQDYFRAAFPNTRLIGCYGNGELGVNHPERPPPDDQPSTVKRHRRDPGPQFGIMYSYSTVFVYIGWGKNVSPPESN